MRKMTIVLAACWFVGALGASGRAQDTAVQDALGQVRKSLDDIRPHGKESSRSLRDLRRKFRSAARPINLLRSQLRESEPQDGANADTLAGALESFGSSCALIIDKGVDSSASVVAFCNEMKSKLAELEAAKAKESDAAKAAALEAERARLALDYDILETVRTSIWVQKAKEVMAPFKGQGTFIGMYDEHRAHRADLLEAWVAIFTNEDEEEDARASSAEGIAQFTDEGDRAGVAAAVRKVLSNPNDAKLQLTCVFLLARIGERAEFEKLLAPIQQKIDEELKKEGGDRGAVVNGYYALSRYYQGINEFEASAKNFTVVAAFRVGLPFENMDANGRGQVANDYYNFACTLSRSNHLDFATMMLEQAFNWGYSDFDWAGKDGDLAAVRAQPAYETMAAAWKNGTKKPGSTPLTAESFSKHAAPMLPDWIKKSASPKSEEPKSEPKPTDPPKEEGGASTGN